VKKPLLVTAAILAPLAAVAIYFGVECVRIVRLVDRNQADARAIAAALSARYPAIRFTGGGGYEQPYICIYATGVADPAVQAGIRDWLAAEKERRGRSDARIRLEFIDSQRPEDVKPAFEL
jgi:hypothetical protein